jgi:hypothetical protein
MGYVLIQLGTLILIGVILANMVANANGTKTFFNGLGSLWGMSINGMLGKPSTNAGSAVT